MVLHGDLKMDNILVFQVTNEPRVNMGDLGSVVQLDSEGMDSKGGIQRSHHAQICSLRDASRWLHPQREGDLG